MTVFTVISDAVLTAKEAFKQTTLRQQRDNDQHVKERLTARDHIAGLNLSNNGAQPLDDIDISEGQCSPAGGGETIILAALTKQIDATWVAGTNQGGLSSSLAAPAASTWYFVHAIVVGGVADVGFDTSAVAANLIADHLATDYRQIGAVLTDGSVNIRAFVQVGDWFWWMPVIDDISDTSVSNAGEIYTISVPPGFRIPTIARVNIFGDTVGQRMVIQSGDETSAAPSGTVVPGLSGDLNSSTATFAVTAIALTDTSARIRARSSSSVMDLNWFTVAYKDPRGRNS